MKKFMLFVIALTLCFVISGCTDKQVQIPGDNIEQVSDNTTSISSEESHNEQTTENSSSTSDKVNDKSSNGVSSNELNVNSSDRFNSGSSNEENNSSSDRIIDVPNNEVVVGDSKEESETPKVLSYAEFISKSREEQQVYMNSFGTDYEGLQKFMNWYSKAKAVYDAEKESEKNEDVEIDIGDYVDDEQEGAQ